MMTRLHGLAAALVFALGLGVATPAGAFPWDDMMPTIQTDCVKHDFTNILGVPLLSGTVWHSSGSVGPDGRVLSICRP